MPEKWSPDPREHYQFHPKLESEIALNRQELLFRESLQRYAFAHKDKERLGALMGKNFIRIYEMAGELNAFGSFGEQRLYERFQQDQDLILEALGPHDGSAVISGFLTEFAVAHMLSHPKFIGADIYFPSDEHDNYEEAKGVDWWVDVSQDYPDNPATAIALQVKSVPFRAEYPLDHLVYPLRNEEDIEAVIDGVLTEDNLRVVKDLDHIHRKVRSSAQRVMTLQHEYENVASGLVLMPTPSSRASIIDPITGRITADTETKQRIADVLWDEISDLSSLDKSLETEYYRHAA